MCLYKIQWTLQRVCIHRWAWRWNSNWIRITRCHILRGRFSTTGKIDKDLHLYEMMDPKIRSLLEQQLMLKLSGSELGLVASTVKESMLRKSSR